jgi:hypothetical protein
MNKFKTTIIWYGKDMPISGFGKLTRGLELYSQQSKYWWFGIKGIGGMRYSKIWGRDYE